MSKSLVRKPYTVIATKNSLTAFEVEADEGIGKEIGKISKNEGEKINAIGFKPLVLLIGGYFLINENGKNLYVREGDVVTQYKYSVVKQPLTFEVTKDKDEESWGRANYAASKFSTMKIQTASNYVIENFNPITQNDIALKINRQPKGQNSVYEVKCITQNPNINKEILEKQVAYYIVSGLQEDPDFPETKK